LLAWFLAVYALESDGKKKTNWKNKALDGHHTERNASPFGPLFDFVSAFIALAFGVNSRQLLIQYLDHFCMIRLRSPLIFSLHIRPKSLNWERDRCWAILRDLQRPVVEWEFTVTSDPRTARQEAESLWDRPVMGVFKGSKQLPIKKGRSLFLCDNYWVKYQYDLLTNLTVWPILIAWWLGYKPDGSVGCVTYSYMRTRWKVNVCTSKRDMFVWLSWSLRPFALLIEAIGKTDLIRFHLKQIVLPWCSAEYALE